MRIKLSKDFIVKLFQDLNNELALQNAAGELYLVGGAVMCLVYESRASTYDLDAFFKPSAVIRQAAKAVAAHNEIDENWLNDGVKGFMSEEGAYDQYIELSNLRVYTAQPEYPLAMKCLSVRIGEEFSDITDISYLLRYLNIATLDEAKEIIVRFYPEERFPAKAFYALKELLGAN